MKDRIFLMLILIGIMLSNIYTYGQTDMPIATIEVYSGYGGVKKVYAVNGQAEFDVVAGVKHDIIISSFGYRSVNLSVAPLNSGDQVQLNANLDTAPLVEGYVKTFNDVGVQGARISFGDIDTISSWNGYYALYVDADIGTSIDYLAGPPINPAYFMDSPYSVVSGGNFYAKLFPYSDEYSYGYTFDSITISGMRVNHNIILPPTTKVLGQLFFQNNTPVSNGEALLVSQNMPLTLSAEIDNGQFLIDSGVSEGTYDFYVRFEGMSGYTDLLVESGLSVSCTPSCPPSVTRGYILPVMVRAEIRILDTDGNPVKNVYIDLKSESGDITASGTSDANGYIRIPLFDSTVYRYTIYLSNYRVLNGTFYIPGGSNPYTKTIEIPIRQFRLSGRIVNIGSELEEIGLLAVGISEYPSVRIETPIEYSSSGTFQVYVPQYLNISGFNVSLNYSIFLDSEYLYAGVEAVNLGYIDRDISNIDVSIPAVETARIRITVTFNGIPETPTNGMRYRLAFWHGADLYQVELANYDPSGICSGFCGAISFQEGWINKTSGDGEIGLSILTVSGYQNEVYLTVPNTVASGDFTALLMDGLSASDMDRMVNGVSISVIGTSGNNIILKIVYNVEQVDSNSILIKPTSIIDEFGAYTLYIILATLALYIILRRFRG